MRKITPFIARARQYLDYILPHIVERVGTSERSWDIFSRLFEDRIIIISGEVEIGMATSVSAQFLWLESQSDDPITVYVNSPGGVVTSGMAIFDVMRYIRCPINTVCLGQAASMGSMMLACGGDQGRRSVMPFSEVLIHQPLGGARGQASDIQIQAAHIQKMKEYLTRLLAEATGKSYQEMWLAMDRDNIFFGKESVDFGLADNVLEYKKLPSGLPNPAFMLPKSDK